MRLLKFAIPPAATVLAALLFAAAPAKLARAAEPAKASVPELGQEGVWTSLCEIDRMTDFRACRAVSHRVFDDGQKTGVISLSVIPTGNDYYLFVTTNLGPLQNCAIRVDRQPRIETHVATYNMCMFPNFLSGRTVDQFRDGSSVLVRVAFPRGGRRDIDFPLSGFTKAFDEMQRLVQ